MYINLKTKIQEKKSPFMKYNTTKLFIKQKIFKISVNALNIIFKYLNNDS